MWSIFRALARILSGAVLLIALSLSVSTKASAYSDAHIYVRQPTVSTVALDEPFQIAFDMGLDRGSTGIFDDKPAYIKALRIDLQTTDKQQIRTIYLQGLEDEENPGSPTRIKPGTIPQYQATRYGLDFVPNTGESLGNGQTRAVTVTARQLGLKYGDEILVKASVTYRMKSFFGGFTSTDVKEKYIPLNVEAAAGFSHWSYSKDTHRVTLHGVWKSADGTRFVVVDDNGDQFDTFTADGEVSLRPGDPGSMVQHGLGIWAVDGHGDWTRIGTIDLPVDVSAQPSYDPRAHTVTIDAKYRNFSAPINKVVIWGNSKVPLKTVAGGDTRIVLDEKDSAAFTRQRGTHSLVVQAFDSTGAGAYSSPFGYEIKNEGGIASAVVDTEVAQRLNVKGAWAGGSAGSKVVVWGGGGNDPLGEGLGDFFVDHVPFGTYGSTAALSFYVYDTPGRDAGGTWVGLPDDLYPLVFKPFAQWRADSLAASWAPGDALWFKPDLTNAMGADAVKLRSRIRGTQSWTETAELPLASGRADLKAALNDMDDGKTFDVQFQIRANATWSDWSELRALQTEVVPRAGYTSWSYDPVTHQVTLEGVWKSDDTEEFKVVGLNDTLIQVLTQTGRVTLPASMPGEIAQHKLRFWAKSRAGIWREVAEAIAAPTDVAAKAAYDARARTVMIDVQYRNFAAPVNKVVVWGNSKTPLKTVAGGDTRIVLDEKDSAAFTRRRGTHSLVVQAFDSTGAGAYSSPFGYEIKNEGGVESATVDTEVAQRLNVKGAWTGGGTGSPVKVWGGGGKDPLGQGVGDFVIDHVPFGTYASTADFSFYVYDGPEGFAGGTLATLPEGTYPLVFKPFAQWQVQSLADKWMPGHALMFKPAMSNAKGADAVKLRWRAQSASTWSPSSELDLDGDQVDIASMLKAAGKGERLQLQFQIRSNAIWSEWSETRPLTVLDAADVLGASRLDIHDAAGKLLHANEAYVGDRVFYRLTLQAGQDIDSPTLTFALPASLRADGPLRLVRSSSPAFAGDRLAKDWDGASHHALLRETTAWRLEAGSSVILDMPVRIVTDNAPRVAADVLVGVSSTVMVPIAAPTLRVVAFEQGLDLDQQVDKSAARPGETLHYTTHYMNRSATALQNVTIRVPIDRALSLRKESVHCEVDVPDVHCEIVLPDSHAGASDELRVVLDVPLPAGAGGALTFDTRVRETERPAAVRHHGG